MAQKKKVVECPRALREYGPIELPESFFDEHEVETRITLPHPLPQGAPPRVDTRSEAVNPYGLPLSSTQLQQLERNLAPLTMHRLIGMFCAAASTPVTVSPMAWLTEITEHARDADSINVIQHIMPIYNHVGATAAREHFDALTPIASDEEACREWALGYTSMLHTLAPQFLGTDALHATLVIQAAAELPAAIELIDAQDDAFPKEERRARCCDMLADRAAMLYALWSEERWSGSADAAAEASARDARRRSGTKVGRNDRCPCGSGKKHKKCCGGT